MAEVISVVEVAEVNKVVRVVEVIEVIRVVEVIKVVELVRKLQGRTKGYPTSSAKLRPNFYTWGAGARGGRPVGPTSRVIYISLTHILHPNIKRPTLRNAFCIISVSLALSTRSWSP